MLGCLLDADQYLIAYMYDFQPEQVFKVTTGASDMGGTMASTIAVVALAVRIWKTAHCLLIERGNPVCTINHH